MKNREVKLVRNTEETQIELKLDIDGTGRYNIDTPIGFLNHMLELFGKHSLFDLEVKAKDKDIFDEHHIVEDIGIVLGQALSQALGDKKGINRYGFFMLPMDEVLATAVLDFSGRFAFRFDCQFTGEKTGDLPTELVYDFWDAFAQNAKCNLFIKVEFGRNDHHKIEAIFKVCARAIRMACNIDKRLNNQVPSTKGAL